MAMGIKTTMGIDYDFIKTEEDKLYELADEFLGGFYEENGIEQLYDIDDAEY